MTTGQLIRELRVKARLTQRELAKACDCDQNTVSRLERDQRAPSSGLARRLADALGTSVDKLITASDSAA